MKAASPELLALLASRQFYAVDLFQFTLSNGAQLHYCSGDTDITWNSVVWSAGGSVGPFLLRQGNRAKCHWKTGIEVDTLVFDVLPGAATLQGQPFLVAVQQGTFDGAELVLYRAFMPQYGNVADGTVILFAGRVAEIDAGRSQATFSVNSHLELLNQNLPRNLYQAGCVNTLFDSACGLSAAAFAVAATVASGSLAHKLLATLTQPAEWFDLGKVVFTSGSNSGVARAVKKHSAGSPSTIELISPLPNPPAAGDGFMLYPGCDKRQATCAGKFSNLRYFRGFPYVPENATAV